MANLTGKTIGELATLSGVTNDTLFPVEYSGNTYHIPYSALTLGGGSYEEITYSELYSLYTGGTLSPGGYYLITDFQSIYDQPDFDQNGLEIIGSYKIGNVEPLVVLATSGNTLSPQAYSPTYPKDKITYDITFTQTERTNEPAKGRITERIDDRNNRADYDLRTIMFRRYNMYYSDQIYKGKIDITTDGTVTGYDTNFTGDFNVDDIFGVYVGAYQEPIGCFKYFKILTVDSNSGMTVTGKTMINESNVYYSKGRQYNTKIGPFQTNIINDLDYSEYKTFPTGVDAFNVYIGDFANYFTFEGYSFLLSNNIFLDGSYQMITLGDLSYNNSFDDDMNSLVFGTDTYNNIITNDFDRNSLGNNFSNNIIMCDMRDNFIQNYFRYNMLGDNDGYDFDSNSIGNNFLANFTSFYNDGFQNNIIGDNFRNNIIDDGFYRNQIGYNFYDNLIFRDFTDNNTNSDFNTNNIYGEFVNNIVGVNFTNNTIGDINDFYNYVFTDNQIGNGFNYNIMFSDFYKNQVGNNFYNNDISGQTTNNVIGNQFENNTIYSYFSHNKISNEFKGNMILQSFEGNNINSFVGGNQFSGNTYTNNIGSFTFDNDFLGYVSDNTWVDNFYGNTIDSDFTYNTIGSDFYGNTIGYGFQHNTIGNNFNNNDIGDNFGYGYNETQGNKIGNNFFYNSIGEYFYNNSIPDNFRNNEVGNYFQWNVINTDITETNFTLNYGNIIGFTYVATGTGATNNLYFGIQICGATESVGVGATFDVEVSGGTVIGVSGNTEGRLYSIGDTLRILGTQIGGVTGVISGFSTNKLSVKIYKPANLTYTYPNNETQMDYLITNSPLFDTYYSNNIQGVSYSTQKGNDQSDYAMVIDGYIKIPFDNTYYFGLSSDDGSDAFINGIKIADWYGAHGDSGNDASGNQYPIPLTAGTYPIKVRMQERSGGDIVTLLYNFGSLPWIIIPDNWFSTNVTGITGTYTNINAQGGNGQNATFDITVVDGLVDSVVLNQGGESYSVGDVLTIPGIEFGGTDDINITVNSLYSDDIIITITGVTSGSLFYDHYTKQIFERRLGDKRVSYYDENDILNISSIYEISGYIPVYSQYLTFPINYTSFEFHCNGSYTNNGGYTGNEVNNTQELVSLFNASFRSYGYFFDNNDGRIGLYINPSLKQQYCPSGTYTINVFND